jgi:DUF1365 family protein
MVTSSLPCAVLAKPTAAEPCIGLGTVRHTRVQPTRHSFAYPTWQLMLPMRAWSHQPGGALARNRRGAVSFHDADHGDGQAGDGQALAWSQRVLAGAGVVDADGEIWLQTYPRLFGFVFKPVSFWYAERADGSLAAVIAEVNNTFGERHSYVLRGAAWGRELTAAKAMHVSPFCEVSGGYRFHFMRRAPLGWRDDARLLARVDHHNPSGAILQTSVSVTLQRLTRASLARAWLAMPLLTFGVVARIHWQALRLWLKRVPFFRKPAPPARLVSH